MILYVELSNKYRYNKQKLVRYRDRRRELWKILWNKLWEELGIVMFEMIKIRLR